MKLYNIFSPRRENAAWPRAPATLHLPLPVLDATAYRIASSPMTSYPVASPEFCSGEGEEGGARTRGARVPKFVVTKSPGSESHAALGKVK